MKFIYRFLTGFPYYFLFFFIFVVDFLITNIIVLFIIWGEIYARLKISLPSRAGLCRDYDLDINIIFVNSIDKKGRLYILGLLRQLNLL